jgi:hypothetical protein
MFDTLIRDLGWPGILIAGFFILLGAYSLIKGGKGNGNNSSSSSSNNTPPAPPAP